MKIKREGRRFGRGAEGVLEISIMLSTPWLEGGRITGCNAVKLFV
jgi:hypothetical protein